ncbi:hypothetical protein C5167_050973 [Papaver somniferum]|uniref:Uncharacterized protein n=1 Tax=Papaver somniferum TaxID=3469 RepID=A0A4Y7KUC3_PAPSO|nr:hypothetical protein C5167_050973 [Papaver somniferum]
MTGAEYDLFLVVKFLVFKERVKMKMQGIVSVEEMVDKNTKATSKSREELISGLGECDNRDIHSDISLNDFLYQGFLT